MRFLPSFGSLRPRASRGNARSDALRRRTAEHRRPANERTQPWPFAFFQLPLAVFVILHGTTLVHAQDTVTIATGDEGGTIRALGKILDYTGRELTLDTAGNVRKQIPAEKVVGIETQYTPQQQEADARMAQHRFAEAAVLYRQALQAESRSWVRRQIIAQMVWCYRALGQQQQAGETFLVLLRSDPQTPDFDCIPLAWAPRQPDAGLEQAARQWMAREEPAAQLLGASHLLRSPMQAAALERLRQLRTDGDHRVASLTTAQLWRPTLVTADAAQVDGWARLVEQMPEPLRAGPYYLVGIARLRQQQWTPAALTLMRLPILYPRHRRLASEALLETAHALEKLGRRAEAARLYGELIRDYPESEAKAEAEGKRLEVGGQ